MCQVVVACIFCAALLERAAPCSVEVRLAVRVNSLPCPFVFKLTPLGYPPSLFSIVTLSSQYNDDNDKGTKVYREPTLDEVKKLYKKQKLSQYNTPGAVVEGQSPAMEQSVAEEAPKASPSTAPQTTADVPGSKTESENVPSLYTVGGTGKVESATSTMSKLSLGGSSEVTLGWLQLDVPCNKTGTLPFQAVIPFSSLTGNAGEADPDKSDKSDGANQAKSDWVTFKIQTCNDGDDQPMLCYNKDKSLKTFIHPAHKNNKCEVYAQISALVGKKGVAGKMGPAGGKKAYFKGKVDGNKIGIVLGADGLTKAEPW